MAEYLITLTDKTYGIIQLTFNDFKGNLYHIDEVQASTNPRISHCDYVMSAKFVLKYEKQTLLGFF